MARIRDFSGQHPFIDNLQKVLSQRYTFRVGAGVQDVNPRALSRLNGKLGWGRKAGVISCTEICGCASKF